jgi:hypothetical protein
MINMTTRLARAALAALPLGACQPVMAQVSWPQATPVKPPTEVLRPQSPVSGEYIRGAGIINSAEKLAEAPADLARVYVRLRRARPLDVCVRISSRDGGYLSSQQYRLPQTERDTYAQIDIASQTRHPERYRRVSPRDFAVLARAGACPADGGAFMVVFWNSPPLDTAPRTLVLAVQSGDRDATLYPGGKAAGRAGLACAPIDEKNVGAFDTLCRQTTTQPGEPELPIEVETCQFQDCNIVKASLLQ